MNVWEKIHSEREWGKYPCEELVRFIGSKFFKIPRENRKNISVLEIGTGQGANVWFFARENFDVYGIDISHSAIEKMKERLSEENILINDFDSRFIICDMKKKFPFDKQFDIIIDCATTLCSTYNEHFHIYKEVYRALKPNGYFWLYHVLKNSWGYATGKEIDKDTFDNTMEGPLANQGTIYYADMCDLLNILKSTGFTIENKEILNRTYENTARQLSFVIITAKK